MVDEAEGRSAEGHTSLDAADVEALSAAAIEELGLGRWPIDKWGNVFAEIELPDPEVHLFRASLVVELMQLIQAGRVDRAHAVRALGADDEALDRILRGDHAGVALDVVVRSLAALGYRIRPRILTIPPNRADDQPED